MDPLDHPGLADFRVSSEKSDHLGQWVSEGHRDPGDQLDLEVLQE